MTNIRQMTDFLLELDALKHINRRSYISGGERLENSAEHSWHLAMACWNIAEHFQLNVDMAKLLQYALVHDLGEVDAGDTFLYSTERKTANEAERQCVKRFSEHKGNHIQNLLSVWDEQEFGDSIEAKLMKAVDRLLPFLLNIAAQGKTWKLHQIKASQVKKAHAFIADDFPELHQWLSENIKFATEQGWLLADDSAEVASE
ncbi:HD domain-containing protein [Methylophaga sulfidovorans]|uniref:5'-deoxynucleotidase n=1 Tax=Methylophaga sulfidovorans TaxID=45496 RepID=A0A1I3Z8K2_9GAMM|nr:HD domain-containing protein [Methylophaga sulfidovorans]SFK40424.1 putative hydrolases of HD superfamily [Methylophaga sulfidovorans]